MMIQKRLINEVKETKKYIAWQVLLQWFALICNIIFIFSFANILEKALKNTLKIQDILIFTLLYVTTMIIRHLLIKKETTISSIISNQVKKKLRHRIYEKLLKLGTKYQTYFTTSLILQKSIEGVEQLEIYFSRYLPQLFYSLLAPITLFVVIFMFSFKIAFILLICVPLIPLSIIAVQKFAKKLLAKYWSSYVEMGDHFLDNLQGLTTLKVYQSDAFKNEEMNKDAEKFRNITMKVLTMQLNSVSLMDFIAYGGSVLGIIFTSIEFIQGNITFTQAIATILLASEFFIPLRLLGSFFHIAMNGMSASDTIFALLDIEEESKKDKLDIDWHNACISLKDASFKYQEKEVLNQVSFDLKPHSFTSIVGASGCGKTTLAKIIGKQLICDNLYINNIKAKNIDEEEWLKHITTISFNNYLFKGSVRENLIVANPNASDDMLWESLKMVNLDAFFLSQNGLDTILLEEASNLSGGQKQRLSIARALLHDSEIYIFDEAGSNIDVESEDIILNLIHTLARHKTILQITHRLSNVVNSDVIYMMKDGKIIGKGSHDTLMEQTEAYRQMFLVQKELEDFGKGENIYEKK